MPAAVRFAGLRARRGPLTWGQRWSWDIVQELAPDEHRHNFGITVPLPPGCTADHVIAVLTALVTRHEPLRTTYRTGPDGQPEQVVRADGVVPLRTRTAAAEEPSAAAAALRADLVRERFDLEGDLPLRMGVVEAAGRLTHLVVALPYMTFDAWGARIFRRELDDALGAGSTDGRATPTGQDPLDRVAFERGEPGRRLADAGLAYWRAQMSTIRGLPEPARRPSGERPRFWCAKFTSAASAQAVALLANRLGVSPSAVVLAAMAAVTGLRLGQTAVPLFVVVSNRHQLTSRTAIGNFSQSSPMVVPLGGPTFEHLVRDTSALVVRASRFAQFDPTDVAPLVHGPGPHRGAHFALPIVYDFHHQTPMAAAPDTTADDLRRAAIGSVLSWSDAVDSENLRLYFQVNRLDAVARLTVWIDTRHLSRADLAAVMFGIERLLIEAVGGEVAMSHLEAVTGVEATVREKRP